jgi:transposase
MCSSSLPHCRVAWSALKRAAPRTIGRRQQGSDREAVGRLPEGREITALGHEVRLLPASYVKPYVKRGKTDAADAKAICEAVTRPTMRFVPVKTAEQQAVLMLHRWFGNEQCW